MRLLRDWVLGQTGARTPFDCKRASEWQWRVFVFNLANRVRDRSLQRRSSGYHPFLGVVKRPSRAGSDAVTSKRVNRKINHAVAACSCWSLPAL